MSKLVFESAEFAESMDDGFAYCHSEFAGARTGFAV